MDLATTDTDARAAPATPSLPPRPDTRPVAADSCARVVRKSQAALALVDGLGRIVTLSPRMALRLALDGPDALNGLPMRSLWSPQARPDIDTAIREARRNTSARTRLDMSYVLGAGDETPSFATVSLQTLPDSNSMLMTLDFPART